MLTLRAYQPADAPELLALFRDTIRRVNVRDYAPDFIHNSFSAVAQHDGQRGLRTAGLAHPDSVIQFGKLLVDQGTQPGQPRELQRAIGDKSAYAYPVVSASRNR